MAKKKLTPKQKKFVHEYIVDLNGTQAAIRAEYSEKTARQIASNLLSKVYIQEAIAIHMAKMAKKTELSAEYVLEGLKEVAERCLQKRPVMVKAKGGGYKQAKDEDGNDVWQFRPHAVNRAFELLGKHLGLFPTNVKHSNDPENPMPIPTVYIPDNGRD